MITTSAAREPRHHHAMSMTCRFLSEPLRESSDGTVRLPAHESPHRADLISRPTRPPSPAFLAPATGCPRPGRACPCGPRPVRHGRAERDGGSRLRLRGVRRDARRCPAGAVPRGRRVRHVGGSGGVGDRVPGCRRIGGLLGRLRRRFPADRDGGPVCAVSCAEESCAGGRTEGWMVWAAARAASAVCRYQTATRLSAVCWSSGVSSWRAWSMA